ncbi:hypothetical protein BTJ39_23200 [Izhakiella australiensis]|uniref:Uncharacterized protein n=1 Tax=Izhakiella australiensis TaxID=1926881 RepID=A0A1S8Y6Q3_9GAMM|nr:hypothetical protein [Izhakiella australiensis]OON34724.1 hypothetical protein BTJ39_23200 [Izhakiella australiensis]
MLYHTSPEIITSIKNGLFGQAVCFSASPYFMSKNPDSAWVYNLDTDALNSGTDFAEDDFWLQRQRYDAAMLIGYDGVEQRDEQWMFSLEKIVAQKPVRYAEWSPFEQ